MDNHLGVLYTVYRVAKVSTNTPGMVTGHGDDDGQDLDDSEEKSTAASSSQASRSERKNP